MLIRFTRATYKSKDEAKASFSHQEWLEGDGGFDLFVALYRAGHIVCVTDPVEADVAILDLDHLTDEEAARVHDEQYLQDICKQLHARRIVRCDSASRVYNKQKLFVEILVKRDISKDGSVDRAYVELRERFQALTGIQCDARMDRPAQVTFGVSTAPSPKLPSRRRSRQPTNKEFVEMVADARSGGSSDRLPVSSSTSEEEARWVPLNMASYNRAYGKERREGGRFEWQTRHYERSPGAVGGHWVKSTIPCGSRHTSRARLIAAAVYNALYQNARYGAGFGLRDVQATVWKTIKYQFEGAEEFLASEGSETVACTASEWSYAQSVPLEEYYQHLIAVTESKGQLSYIPRDIAARRLYFEHQELFAQCTSPAEAKGLAGDIAQGEVQLMQKLLYHHRRHSASRPKGRPGNYEELLRDAPRTPEGYPIVPKRLRHNAVFRRYLKEHSIGKAVYR